ncbi:Cytoplasmic and mitochondrial histidine tRNA synthetase [Cadophora gregata]|uniref:Cytoplasmic and mitochondrial histidine tRNA synthetase n=1 Tax=Cadophora gregata TaxID=51156 RepID=UPI0026DC1053|nr:Cytoplasmic and mitochondrial histidine tRNA synthetase [Cadophora gregata]KAK0126081.1 Cytoplasmic and mitochondrial histidine tRNA synthetase [Cadophora gregata]
MTTFQTQLLRSARSIPLTPGPRAFNLITATRIATFGNTRNFSITARRRTEEDDEMAPKGQKFELKTPKGTKDWEGKDMVIRDKIFSTITDVFKRHGAVTIDTPVFELKEILSGKYGEDSKLIYDLADQGGEICSLRYDLTVPFARWLAMNRDVQNIKRYHIAKVYRRDQPAMTKGRMREFYQCDFDIAGTYDPMLPDAEVIRITTEVFEGLGWKGAYTIKLNHRKILDGIFEVCGVPTDKIRTISSAVDKLDKLPWLEVRKEMTEEKGLAPDIADKIGEYVVLKGQKDLLARLKADEKLAANESMKAGIADLELLFEYLEAFRALDNVSFDLSLARGLDYYTGLIYEVVTEGSAGSVPVATTSTAPAAPPKSSKKPSKEGADADEDRSSDPSVGVGSVAAGGRYDKLVGMFSGKNQIPCVGISFGVDRIFSITKARMAAEKNAVQVRNNEVDVFVMAFGGKGFTGLLKERMDICSRLWEAGIKAEFLYKVKPKLPNQFRAAEVNGVPFTIVIGEDEVAQGKVKVKEMGLRDGHPEKEGILVDLVDVVAEVKQRLRRKADLEGLFREAEGLRVVDGIKGDAEKLLPPEPTASVAELEKQAETTAVPDPEKPAEETPASQEAIGAVPAS